MRLFAAVEPSTDAQSHLDAALADIRQPPLRWTTADAWHLTLAFYGEVADRRVDDLIERLGRVGRRNPTVELQLAGAGRFDGRALWIGCAGEVDVLTRIARSCAAAGRRVGADVDQRRRFRLHLTVARSSQPRDLRSIVEALGDYAGPRWSASAFSLIRSRLGAGEDGRPSYDIVANIKLSG